MFGSSRLRVNLFRFLLFNFLSEMHQIKTERGVKTGIKHKPEIIKQLFMLLNQDIFTTNGWFFSVILVLIKKICLVLNIPLAC